MDRTSFITRNQSNIPLPAPMPMVKYAKMPSVAGIGGLGATPAPIDPTDLTQRLPSIVNPTAVNLAATCNPFVLWVSENPVLAGAGLAVIAYLTIFKGGKK